MKKLDKFIISSFVGPFLLTFVVVVFILLTQYMLKYFDDFVGKDLGMDVFAELIMYFSINMTPVALPLAVLLSSLMTFGNMGEHFELTAIKGAGISLTRAVKPLFFFVLLISFLGFLSNNYVVPKANLKAYSLLYDIKQKKPALDIREGVFYGGIPQYEIKVNKKYPDGETLKEIIIYDHRNGLGNKNVILADSGRMYTVNNDRFLKLELYNGNRYSEENMPGTRGSVSNDTRFTRNSFEATTMVFSLASFDMQRTKEEYFAQHRRMKTMGELATAIDSLSGEKLAIEYQAFVSSPTFYTYHLRYDSLMPENIRQKALAMAESDTSLLTYETDTIADDSLRVSIERHQQEMNEVSNSARQRMLRQVKEQARQQRLRNSGSPLKKEKYIPSVVDSSLIQRADTFISDTEYSSVIAKALNQSKTINNTLQINTSKIQKLEREVNKDLYESRKKIAQAISCIIMFLIGAPLGAIIKKGGLGFPVLISICFFIAFYVLTEMSRKWADELLMDAEVAVWFPNIVLLPFGILFMLQARLDTRILEPDFYKVWLDKLSKRFQLVRKKVSLQ
ncbi:lipopolysaccharide export system permease protein [Catalinimonas alkaloidigena]|uniref:LptF/LptG family permease n=1 Tax=Catalinimonas alkaloidigena TaxID=1075417 RepID=UPI0024059A11|nr:LptF/LptG family permease [Catalinimonas alkaloidigena]MDF9795862.1 lipopolysaccharide export system permease protein [Catalinimonas alkaloidigena]